MESRVYAVTPNVKDRLRERIGALTDDASEEHCDRLARFWTRMEQSDVIGECVGKVGTLPGTIMEMRALKLCIKPMLVVPNVDLASKEFEGAYPMARNLVVANSDVEKTVRKQCLTEIDSFSGDVVICGRKACEYLLGTGRRFPEMGIDAIVVAYHDSWPSYTSVMKMWNCLESNSRLHPQDPEVLPVLRF